MEIETKKLVSVIVPVYNVKNYIVETIESVRAQSYTQWELLLVEDGSQDGTAEVIHSYLEEVKDERIRLLSLPQNGGAARARNAGLKEAKGRYITYLDADDVWMPEKLEHQLAFVEKTQAAFSFTGYEFADEKAQGSGKIVKVPSTLSYQEALKNTTIWTTTVMFDTSKISKEALEMPIMKSEDTALWWRVLRSGYTAYGLNENLAKYRRAGKSLSSNKLEAIRRIWNLYRKSEGLGILKSAYLFCFWAVRAVKRRV